MKPLARANALVFEILFWAVYLPLFKTGKIERLEVMKFDGRTIDVVTTRTWLFSTRLYSVSQVPEDEDTAWRDLFVQQGVVVIVSSFEGQSIEAFRGAHPALARYELDSGLHMQFSRSGLRRQSPL